MGGSCQFHRLLALSPQGVENNQQTYWQVWTLLSPVPRLGKLHRLATREERGTQDRGSRVSEPFRSEELAAALRRLKPGKSPALDSIFPEFILHVVSALKSWFCDSSLHACANSKFQRSGEEHK